MDTRIRAIVDWVDADGSEYLDSNDGQDRWDLLYLAAKIIVRTLGTDEAYEIMEDERENARNSEYGYKQCFVDALATVFDEDEQ